MCSSPSHLGGLSFDSLQYIQVFVGLMRLKLDTVLRMWSQKCWIKRKDHFAGPSVHTLVNTAQDVISLFCCQGTRPTHIQRIGPQILSPPDAAKDIFINLGQDLPGKGPKACGQAITYPQLTYVQIWQLLGTCCLLPIPDQVTGGQEVTCPSPVAFCFPAVTEQNRTAFLNPMEVIWKEYQGNCSAGKCGWKCRSSTVRNLDCAEFVKTALLAAETVLLLQQHRTDVGTS